MLSLLSRSPSAIRLNLRFIHEVAGILSSRGWVRTVRALPSASEWATHLPEILHREEEQNSLQAHLFVFRNSISGTLPQAEVTGVLAAVGLWTAEEWAPGWKPEEVRVHLVTPCEVGMGTYPYADRLHFIGSVREPEDVLRGLYRP